MPGNPPAPRTSRFLNVFARVGDGRIGWRDSIWRNHTDARELTIVLGPVGQVRGRLNDQDGRPIAGAEVMPVSISRPAEEHPGQDCIRLSPELAGPFRTKTAADGSFALDGIPPGCRVIATIAAPGFGKPWISWDASRPVSIVLDGRLGRIEGRLKPPADRGLSGKLSVSLRRKILARGSRLGPVPDVLLPDRPGRSGWRSSGSTTCHPAAMRSSPSSASDSRSRADESPGGRGRPEGRRQGRDAGPVGP